MALLLNEGEASVAADGRDQLNRNDRNAGAGEVIYWMGKE